MTTPCCILAQHLDAAAIDDDLRAGNGGIRVIAERYGLRKCDVEAHRKHLGITGRPQPGVMPSAVSRHDAQVASAKPPRSAPRPSSRSMLSPRPAQPPLAPSGTPASNLPALPPPEPAPDTSPSPRQEAGQPDSRQDGCHDNDYDVPADVTVVEPTRAQVRDITNPSHATTYRERVEHVAYLVAAGQWRGCLTANELARLWGFVGTPKVYELRRAAEVLLQIDRGPVEEMRSEAIGVLRDIRDQARDANDRRAAVAAQAEVNKIVGLHPGTQSNSLSAERADQAFTDLWGRIAEKLRLEGETRALSLALSVVRVWKAEQVRATDALNVQVIDAKIAALEDTGGKRGAA